MSSEPRYATVILDVDSTVSTIEGIDWLAELRGPKVSTEIADLTTKAMAGEIRLDAIYGERLRIVAPTKGEVNRLGQAYIDTLTAGCRATVEQLQTAGVRVLLISGGLRQAVLFVGGALGIPASDVHAVELQFTRDGHYADFDKSSPLAANGGKRTLVDGLDLRRPVLAAGDGATDADMKPAVDVFAAFTGVVRRQPVVDVADIEVRAFAELTQHVLGPPAGRTP